MARNVQQKLEPGNKSGLAQTGKPNTNLLSAALLTVDPTNNTVNLNNALGYFLLNPSSWDEHKPSNWVQHAIPGESDPILQWVSGGARTITVEALVTKDHSGFNILKSNSSNLLNQAATVVGNIASSFAGIIIPSLGDLLPIGNQGAGEELSIADNLNYYRSLTYPLTDKDRTVLSGSPPLVALFAGKSFSRDMAGETISVDTDLWVVTDLRIRITKQLPNLTPMEASVTFQLVQYTRRTKDQTDFTGIGNITTGVDSNSLSQALASFTA